MTIDLGFLIIIFLGLFLSSRCLLRRLMKGYEYVNITSVVIAILGTQLLYLPLTFYGLLAIEELKKLLQ